MIHLRILCLSLPYKKERLNYTEPIILLFFYGCESRFVTLMEKFTPNMFKKRVVWKIFGPKKEEADSL